MLVAKEAEGSGFYPQTAGAQAVSRAPAARAGDRAGPHVVRLFPILEWTSGSCDFHPKTDDPLPANGGCALRRGVAHRSRRDRLRRFGVTPRALLGLSATWFIAAEFALVLRIPIATAVPRAMIARNGRCDGAELCHSRGSLRHEGRRPRQRGSQSLPCWRCLRAPKHDRVHRRGVAARCWRPQSHARLRRPFGSMIVLQSARSSGSCCGGPSSQAAASRATTAPCVKRQMTASRQRSAPVNAAHATGIASRWLLSGIGANSSRDSAPPQQNSGSATITERDDARPARKPESASSRSAFLPLACLSTLGYDDTITLVASPYFPLFQGGLGNSDSG
jgi:hypothetical protein